jgi:hypothetical protein
MALANMSWEEISIHHVVSQYLRNDRGHYASFPQPWQDIIDNPNISDTLENHMRLRMFYIKSGLFMVEIPPDTKWYEVKNLTDNELDELYVSARHNPQWNQAGSKLDKVAIAEKLQLTSSPAAWGRIILWGHDKSGPFSIIEGNHRMLAYIYNPQRPLDIPVYIGLSSSYCFWHYADPGFLLGNDLYKKARRLQERNGWIWVT